MCRVGNKERLYFGDLLRIFLWLYISQTLRWLSDAPLFRTDGRKTLRGFFVFDIITRITRGLSLPKIVCYHVMLSVLKTYIKLSQTFSHLSITKILKWIQHLWLCQGCSFYLEWTHLNVFSNVASDCLPERIHNHIVCICLDFLHCVLSNVSSKHLHKRMHNHTGCICLAFLHCVFSNESSNCLRRRMHSHIDCICLAFLHCVLSNVSSKHLQKTASQKNPSYECGEGMKLKVVKWCWKKWNWPILMHIYDKQCEIMQKNQWKIPNFQI